MARPLVHPRLMQSLINHYPQQVTIEGSTTTRDDAGQPVETWSVVYIGLDCMIWDHGGLADGERRTNDETLIIGTHRIAPRGYYPLITEAMRATDNRNRTFNILQVEHDSQSSATYLQCEIVT